MILAAVWGRHNQVMFWLLLAAASLTAFYMTCRLFALTFVGDDRDHEKFHHAHESPALITVPARDLRRFLDAFAGMGLPARDGFTSTRRSSRRPRSRAMPGAIASYEAAASSAREPNPWPGSPRRNRARKPSGTEEAEMRVVVHHSSWPAWSSPPSSSPSASTAARSSRHAAVDPLGLRAPRRGAWTAAGTWTPRSSPSRLAVRPGRRAGAFWIDDNVVDRIFVDGWGLLMRDRRRGQQLPRHQASSTPTVDGVGRPGQRFGPWAPRSLVADGRVVQEYLMYAAIAFALSATLILTR